MKALRKLKKHQPKIQDPQKVAEEKLAIISDEPFSDSPQTKTDPITWTISSFNQQPRKDDYLSLIDTKSVNKLSEKGKIYSSFLHRNKLLLQTCENDKNLSKWFKQDIQQNTRISKNPQYTPERKTLILTSYILFDKKKNYTSEEKKSASKCEFQRLKMLQLKRILASKREKKYANSYKKINMSETKSSHITRQANPIHSKEIFGQSLLQHDQSQLNNYKYHSTHSANNIKILCQSANNIEQSSLSMNNSRFMEVGNQLNIQQNDMENSGNNKNSRNSKIDSKNIRMDIRKQQIKLKYKAHTSQNKCKYSRITAEPSNDQTHLRENTRFQQRITINQDKSHSQVRQILSNIVKRKEIPNMNLRKYSKQNTQYQKLKNQSILMIQPLIHSTKITLQQYYKKFIF